MPEPQPRTLGIRLRWRPERLVPAAHTQSIAIGSLRLRNIVSEVGMLKNRPCGRWKEDIRTRKGECQHLHTVDVLRTPNPRGGPVLVTLPSEV